MSYLFRINHTGLDAPLSNITTGKPSGSIGILSATVYIIIKIDTELSRKFDKLEEKQEIKLPLEMSAKKKSKRKIRLNTSVLKASMGKTNGPFNVGMVHYAVANLAVAKVGTRELSASVSVFSASAHCEYGLNNSVGANASLARAEVNFGPLRIGFGVSLDCLASVGVDGVEACLLGLGVSIGPRFGVRTPFFDLCIKLI